jgi:putative phosphoribosyl transferase
MLFTNRVDAGHRLAEALKSMDGKNVVVVGLPRGGVPVAFEVARVLGAPLDVIVVRKLGVPFQPELGMGAVGEGGARIINDEVVRLARVSKQELADVERRERAEVERRAHHFRGNRTRVPLAGRTVVVVDDGIATGSTARVACQVARAQGAAKVVLAVPVGPEGVEQRMHPDADEVVCLYTPATFFGIGQFYDDFAQASDHQVVDLLHRATNWPAGAPVAQSVAIDPQVT